MLKNKRSLGFTLTELVVTTAIMGTLAAVSIPSYIETQAKAKSEKTMSTISEMGQKLGQVYNELSGQYGGMILLGESTSDGATIYDDTPALAENANADSDGLTLWGAIYAGGVPVSPFGDKNYGYQVITPGSVTYTQDAVTGNISIAVDQSTLRIFDYESPDQLFMDFSY